MSDFHIIVIFNDYYTLIIAFLTKQIQNRYRYRRLPDTHHNCLELKMMIISSPASQFHKEFYSSMIAI